MKFDVMLSDKPLTRKFPSKNFNVFLHPLHAASMQFAFGSKPDVSSLLRALIIEFLTLMFDLSLEPQFDCVLK
jgi:hypothetical protein